MTSGLSAFRLRLWNLLAVKMRLKQSLNAGRLLLKTASITGVMPTLLISELNVPFYFGGTALLIVVGVAIDTISQIESHLIMRNYDGFMKAGRIRGRR